MYTYTYIERDVPNPVDGPHKPPSDSHPSLQCEPRSHPGQTVWLFSVALYGYLELFVVLYNLFTSFNVFVVAFRLQLSVQTVLCCL